MDGMMSDWSMSVQVNTREGSRRDVIEVTAIAVSQLSARAQKDWPGRQLSFRKEWNGDLFEVTVFPYPEMKVAV